MNADGPARRWVPWRWGLLLLAPLAALSATPSPGATLLDAIRLAYQTNPTLRGQRAELRAIGEGYVQARAGLGPTVSLNGQGGYSIARVQSRGSQFTPSTDTTYEGSTGTAALSFVQPVLSFGANSAKIRGAKDTVLAGQEGLRQAEAEMIGKVITAYLDVRRDREVLRIERDEIGNLLSEFDEIKAKGDIGQVTRTDVAEAQARLLQTQGQFDLIQGRLMANVAEYLDVVGENPGELEPEPRLVGLPETIDEAFTVAEHNNPQILDALQSELAAREKVNEAKAAYGPTLSMRVDAGVQPIEPYLPNLYDRNVTVAAVVSQPLFTSGMRSSKVREAIDRDSQAIMQIETARRDVVKAVAQAWSQLIATKAAVARASAEVDADRVAVEGNQVEERVGRRSTFELLNNEAQLATARIGLLQNQHDAYLAQAAVLAAMGLLEARYITPGLETYDSVHVADHAQGAVPWEGAFETIDSAVSRRQIAAPSLSGPGAGSQRPTITPPDPDPRP
jgi:outer membrane protein